MWPDLSSRFQAIITQNISANHRRTILIVGTTILVYHTFRGLVNRLPVGEGFLTCAKRGFYALLRKVPSIRREIDEQMALTTTALETHVEKLYKGEFTLQMPKNGITSEEILKNLEEYINMGEYDRPEHRLSGATYFNDPAIEKLYTAVYERTLWTNLLHYEVFPGVCKMEAEIIRMACRLFGDFHDECCGTITSGGTESIILAVKAYRDFATGIRKPEILVPITAHSAFKKAAQLLGIRLRRVPLESMETCAVDVARMEAMITRNTCMLVASAPAYPHGCMDDVDKVAALGLKYGIPVHVDACLGGILLAFKERAGFAAEAFDFRVKGVSSISVDTHKYGFTPKGSSLLLFRDPCHRRAQYFTDVDWPGGLYASATLAGSKCGASVAACWAAFHHFGEDGYMRATKRILEASAYIRDEVSRIEGLVTLGKPQLSVIAWSSDEFDIYSLLEAMSKKGWTMNALQFPPAIHICVSYPQSEPDVAVTFVKDMRSCVHELRNSPDTVPPSGDEIGGIYGSSQKVPFRELIHETACIFLDTLSKTQFNGNGK